MKVLHLNNGEAHVSVTAEECELLADAVVDGSSRDDRAGLSVSGKLAEKFGALAMILRDDA